MPRRQARWWTAAPERSRRPEDHGFLPPTGRDVPGQVEPGRGALRGRLASEPGRRRTVNPLRHRKAPRDLSPPADGQAPAQRGAPRSGTAFGPQARRMFATTPSGRQRPTWRLASRSRWPRVPSGTVGSSPASCRAAPWSASGTSALTIGWATPTPACRPGSRSAATPAIGPPPPGGGGPPISPARASAQSLAARQHHTSGTDRRWEAMVEDSTAVAWRGGTPVKPYLRSVDQPDGPAGGREGARLGSP
jgi:hypothetical protein